jgi:hypothetical protein
MERQIIIGLIVSTDYIKQIKPLLELYYFEASVARTLAQWCFEYYEEYETAIGADIKLIYENKVRQDLISEELAEEIEEDILPDLNDQFIVKGISVNHLLSKTNKWISERRLGILSLQISELQEKGKTKEANELIVEYKALSNEVDDSLDMSSPKALERVKEAFSQTYQNVVHYPGAIGELLNGSLTRGSLVGIMAPEKRGKTFFLLDMAFRAVRQGKKVAFFQAGDMTEAQQLRRMGIYLNKKSDKKKFTGDFYLPVKDCIYNQLDLCDKAERECDFGIFDDIYTEQNLTKEITFDELKEAYENEPDYKPCHNCKAYRQRKIGTPWLEKINVKNELTEQEAVKSIDKFFVQAKRQLKLSTHANGTLSVDRIEQILNGWELSSAWVPDLILVDYADLLVAPKMDFRQSQNVIWQGLRRLSQTTNACTVAPTQTDANSYIQTTLGLGNFSEDKRKFSHVTDMFGLNQDPEGREKKIGILRVNALLAREDSFDITNSITILQRLEIGRPLLSSYL